MRASKLFQAVLTFTAIWFAGSGVVRADEYPVRPVRLIVPYAAGGPADFVGRLVADRLSHELEQQFVVENRGGAGGMIGTMEVVRADSDGYTLLLGATGNVVISPHFNKTAFDPLKDLVPLGLVAQSSQAFVVHPSLGVHTLKEFVAYAKAHPGAINAGSAGVGSFGHLLLALLMREADIKLTHVPYRGTGAALTDILGDHIQAMAGDLAVLVPYLKAKTLIGLAVTSPNRSPLLPNLITTKEAGYPEIRAATWYGVLGPRNLPEAVRNRLDVALQHVVLTPMYQKALIKQGAVSEETSSKQFAEFIRSESAKWGDLAVAVSKK